MRKELNQEEIKRLKEVGTPSVKTLDEVIDAIPKIITMYGKPRCDEELYSWKSEYVFYIESHETEAGVLLWSAGYIDHYNYDDDINPEFELHTEGKELIHVLFGLLCNAYKAFGSFFKTRREGWVVQECDDLQLLVDPN